MDRRRMLSVLEKENLKLNEIAKRFDMTATETLRQLQKMTEASLIEKMPDGKYRTTTYARLILYTSSRIDFISQFRGYFLEHDASTLPSEYRERLGELSGCKLSTNAIETMNHVTDMLRQAQESIDATIELGFQLHLELMKQRIFEGVKVRWLMQESSLAAVKSIFHSKDQLPEMRSIPRILGHIYLTDKAGAITLRRTDGNMSYSAFIGADPPFLKWASDLYADEWKKAKPWFPYMGVPAVS
jgi:predicted transcriptional regulator